MAESSIRITGTVTNTGSGGKDIDSGALTNSDCPKATTTQRINATYAAITFPAVIGSEVATGVYIKPLNGSGTITLKGASGDTGWNIHNTRPTFLSLASVSASPGGITTTTDVTFEFVWV